MCRRVTVQAHRLITPVLLLCNRSARCKVCIQVVLHWCAYCRVCAKQARVSVVQNGCRYKQETTENQPPTNTLKLSTLSYYQPYYIAGVQRPCLGKQRSLNDTPIGAYQLAYQLAVPAIQPTHRRLHPTKYCHIPRQCLVQKHSRIKPSGL